MMLFMSPPASPKRVEHSFLPIKINLELEGNVRPIMLATGKVHLESERDGGEKQVENLIGRRSNLRVEFCPFLFPWP